MARVRGKNTRPEMVVRRLVHAMGYRYRLHDRRLPGQPDLVFPRLKRVIQVHGCFWHRHPRCALARLPKSRADFWLPKLKGNRARDLKNARKLRRLGWDQLIVWECQLADRKTLRTMLGRYLSA
jgi:DNA mismatch endonuclease (patch repair protein)